MFGWPYALAWFGWFVVRVILLGIAVIVIVSFIPVQTTQPSAFADPAFSELYELSGPYGQALLWGSGPLVSVVEPYTGAPGNRRLVQYFDRGRMELVNGAPAPVTDVATAASTTTTPLESVTQGLLVREMATGNVQVGHDAFVQGDPASLPVFGSAAATGDAVALTYADFSNAASTRAGNRTQDGGALVDQWITPGGLVTAMTAPVEVRAERYVEATGHNIPDVIVAWLQRQPFGSLSDQDALGYPITEAFWVYSGKGTGGVSLIQLFERRVVVYTPDLPEGERFTLTNSGRHYYRWRYGNDVTASANVTQRSVVPVVRDDAGLTLPQGYHASILARGITDLFGMAVAPNGQIALGHLDGTVTLLDPANPEGRSAPLIQHLANPVALAYAGTDLYVADDTGLHRYRDVDADGRVDAVEDIDVPRFVRETIRLTPGPDGTLYYCGQPLDPYSATPTPVGEARNVVLISPDDTRGQSVPLEIDAGGPLVIAVDGEIWTFDEEGRLLEIAPGNRVNATLETGMAGDTRTSGIYDLLLYRADGSYGDPYSDMLALTSGENGTNGRVMRVLPARGASTLSSMASPVATQPGAIVDFITGFDRPTLASSGLDGALFIYDAGRGHIYAVRPL